MGIAVDDGATATMTLYLQKKNGRLGISIDDDNFVHDVDEGSAGQEAGFCIGDWVSCQHTSLFPFIPGYDVTLQETRSTPPPPGLRTDHFRGWHRGCQLR